MARDNYNIINCNDKTTKNKDSSIPNISNGQAVLFSRNL